VAAAQVPLHGPIETPYTQAFFETRNHDPAVPTPASILGERYGSATEPTSSGEIVRMFEAWKDHPRVKLVEYARSHAGRPLIYAVITSPKNHARLDAIKTDLAKLADPRTLSKAEADALSKSTPAVAWMAYAIHGNEPSGGDAAIQLAYHLIASTDEATTRLLDDVIVIVDPVQNPDGRDRYINRLRDNDTFKPSEDSQSLRASRPAPSGRMNHYMFDLNRDWLPAVHPETQGRIREVLDWRPLMLVDGHEMSIQDTYLFGPARSPVNENQIAHQRPWNDRFARAMSGAFSTFGWTHYSGEWNDDLYPGYSSSWIIYTGGVGLLYEQAHSGGDGVRLHNTTVRSYRQSVHQQIAASIACLTTLHAGLDELKADYLAGRRQSVATDGPFAARSWVFVDDGNASRMRRLTDLLTLQRIEYTVADAAFDAEARDRLGRAVQRSFPAGSIVVPGLQPEGRMASVMLEFDRKLGLDFLNHERSEIVKGDGPTSYDVTAWNIPMMFDLDAYELASIPSVQARTESPAALAPKPEPQAYAYIIDGVDDASVAAAARLMEAGLKVRIARKPFRFDERTFARGSVVVARDDNPGRDTAPMIESVASALGLGVASVAGGYGLPDPTLPAGDFRNDDPADLGGDEFVLLERPRIALLGYGPFDSYSFGEVWFEIDQRLKIDATYITADSTNVDWRRYNVIILPDSNATARVRALLPELRRWVEAGGTLIALEASAGMLASGGEGAIGSVRQLDDVLGELDAYELAVLREIHAREKTVSLDALYDPVVPTNVSYPWREMKRPSLDELKRRNAWQAQFSPQGAIVAARADDEHWLTLGVRSDLPALVQGSRVLMAGSGVEVPIRLGVIEDAPAAEAEASEKDGSKPERASAGLTWVNAGPTKQTRLRMSGLLWPEAADRIAHSALLTRESVGRGQVILFAQNPNFRAMMPGTTRVFNQAVIYGPGLGASAPIVP
jgi:hypothetical protein